MTDSPVLPYPAKGAFTISTLWVTTAQLFTVSSNAGKVARSIYVGGAGTLGLRMLDGSTGIFPGALAGMTYPFRAIGLSTLNTATSLVGVY